MLVDLKNVSSFWSGEYAFLDDDSMDYRGSFSNEGNVSFATSIADSLWPNIWAPADRLAKAMFSVVTADLGATILGNESMIATPDTLHYWTENLTQIFDASIVSDKESFKGSWRMTQYSETGDQSFNFTPSTISATYTCQVPRLKSGFNIFISILVADLVLLRVAWTLYNYVVCYFLKDRHPDSNLCPGCLERGQSDDAGSEELATVDVGEDIEYQGRDVELDDLGRDHEEPADQQSLQKLLTGKPVGS